MSEEQMNVDQNTLVDAWKKQLPEYLNPGDSAKVQADMANPQGLRIHINAAGHQMFSFDFSCSYMDPREVRVELVDVERAGQTVAENTAQIQELTGDYVRHIHECAQALGQLTNP